MASAFMREFARAARQGPRIFFSPLIGVVDGVRAGMQLINEIKMDDKAFHKQQTVEAIFRSGTWLKVSEGSSERLEQLESAGEIFGITYMDEKYYARYQFDSHMQPLQVIQQILINLSMDDPWAIAAWFCYPNSWLSENQAQVAPKDVLGDHERVIKAASMARGTYVA